MKLSFLFDGDSLLEKEIGKELNIRLGNFFKIINICLKCNFDVIEKRKLKGI